MKILLLVLLTLFITTIFGQNEGVIAYSITPPNDNNEIFVINADGTGNTQLTIHEGRDIGPAWSPDASKIAFYTHSEDESKWSIFVMDSNGDNIEQLTYMENVYDNSPTWSPDGAKIAFAREYPLQNYISELWIMDSNGDNQHQIASIAGNGPEWSGINNQIVYYSYNTGDAEIYTMNPDGTNIQQLTNTNSDNIWPAWSANGERIVFVSDRDNNYEIYIMDANGFNQERLTENNYLDYRPDCSPDGTQIAFLSDRDGNFEIYLMNIDGSNQERLTYTNVHAIQADWRPDIISGIDDQSNAASPIKSSSIQVFPNPSKSDVTIHYSIVSSSHINLTITDSRGKLVKTLVDKIQQKGVHEINWNGTNGYGQAVPSGVYYCRLQTDEVNQCKKIYLLKN